VRNKASKSQFTFDYFVLFECNCFLSIKIFCSFAILSHI